MKKLYALLMLALPMLGFAQNDVTFIVDMTNYSGSTANGVYVNGSFNGWCGTCNPMSDPEGDSIWTVTLPISASTFEYKFTVDGWSAAESFDTNATCIQPGPYFYDAANCGGYCVNRYAAVAGDTILPGVEWNSCSGVAGKVYMTFQVNMSYTAVDASGVFIAGGSSFGVPGDNEMYPIGDSVYSKTLRVDTGFYSMFVFTSSSDVNYSTKEQLSGKPCAAGTWNDRDMVGYGVGNGLMGDFHYRTCFGQCSTDGSCVAPNVKNVTFNVDMNNYTGTIANGVYLNGSFNGWCGTCNVMDDSDGDGIWSTTLPLADSTIEFKFTVDGWNDAESFDTLATCIQPGPYFYDAANCGGYCVNRYAVLLTDTVLPEYEWNSCSEASIGFGENAAALSVMPNPASDVLYFENTTGETARVLVFDITGALVRNINVEGEARLDVSAMPRGMYIVRMQTATSEKVVRVALN